MPKKTKPKKTKTTSGSAGDAGAPRKRGRKPNAWIEGFGPSNLIDYRQKHGMSEAKLAKYLGVTLTTVRNWISGANTPSEAKQNVIKELLSKDYVAPLEGEKKPRGRRKRTAEAANGGSESGDGQAVRSSALAEVVAAYVRRLPPEQLLDIDQLEKHIGRIKKALAN